MSGNPDLTNGKIVVALRAARAAIGWSQEQFALRMGVAKSTVARIETLEMAPKGDFVVRAMEIFRATGIEVDLYDPKTIPLKISLSAVEDAIKNLTDPANRRSDKRTAIHVPSDLKKDFEE